MGEVGSGENLMDKLFSYQYFDGPGEVLFDFQYPSEDEPRGIDKEVAVSCTLTTVRKEAFSNHLKIGGERRLVLVIHLESGGPVEKSTIEWIQDDGVLGREMFLYKLSLRVVANEGLRREATANHRDESVEDLAFSSARITQHKQTFVFHVARNSKRVGGSRKACQSCQAK